MAEGQQGRFELANLVLNGQPYRASSYHHRQADRPDDSALVVNAGGDGDQSTSGGVLKQYVGARRLSATKQMRLFQQPARQSVRLGVMGDLT